MAYTKDYYHILGLSPGPSSLQQGKGSTSTAAAELRRAYKIALLAAHPDKWVVGSGGGSGDVIAVGGGGMITATGKEKKKEKEKPLTQAGGTATTTRDTVGAVANTKPAHTSTSTSTSTSTYTSTYTIDDVKEAYAHLGDPARKRAYDHWWVLQRGRGAACLSSCRSMGGSWDTGVCGCAGGGGGGASDAAGLSSDFILGLEVLDLGDFVVVEERGGMGGGEQGQGQGERQGGVGDEEDGDDEGDDDGDDDGDDEGEGQVEWTRSCRCGADTGFRIVQGELEDAEQRGEREVLVGCAGCSLWVRVGFDVEVG